MIVILALSSVAPTLDGALDEIKRLLSEASIQDAEMVCFPEAHDTTIVKRFRCISL